MSTYILPSRVTHPVRCVRYDTYTTDIQLNGFILYKDIITITFEDYQESLTLRTFNI